MITPYHAKYFAYELTKRSASDSIQKLASTLVDAQVDLNPHQVDAALFAFRSPLSKGAILADEVGLGKTIEAGLVISQKWAERKRKILIIVPSNLRKQWHQELADKFFLPSILLESATFNKAVKRGKLNPFESKKIVICSYHFARNKDTLVQSIPWDLVVIDEAHRLRNVYKPKNKIANAIKDALVHVPKLLLTATPLQNSLLELYGLVSIIDHYTFGDLKSFKRQFSRLTGDEHFYDIQERLKPICQRTLRRQVLEYIKYTNRTAVTQEFFPTEDEQRLYDMVSAYLQRTRLYALPASQRHLMTLILRKLLASSTYAIAGTLEALSIKLEGLIEEQEVINDESFFADYESFEEQSEEWPTESSEPVFYEKPPELLSPEDKANIQKEINDLKTFKQLADSIIENSKGQVLLKALGRGFKETERLGSAKKAIIFTESRRTQLYLKKILESSNYQGKVCCFNGSNNDAQAKAIYQSWLKKHEGTDRVTGSRTADTRAALVDFFRDEAIIMIATEAAAEGLNLQFCSLVVNYDMPWNPQRIEQRIGRCHRYGQLYDVVVVNFLNKKNAADVRVYELLQQKFKLFSGVFGASDEILGSIESGVDFEKRIGEIYQECRTPKDIQLSFNLLQKELDDQIQDRMQNTRQKLLENFDEEVHEKLRINLEESKEYLNRYEGWLWQLTCFHLNDFAEFDHDEHSFRLKRNPFPDEKIHPGPYVIRKTVDGANTYRIAHTLAQRIITLYKQEVLQSVELIFDYSNNPKKISILEPYLGKTGWLEVRNLTVNSFETEDYVLLAGLNEEGKVLDPETCRRLFSCAAVTGEVTDSSNIPVDRLNELLHGYTQEILQENAQRNASFFETEMEKLEKWADDLKSSLEMQLKELDKEIKFRKTEAKKLLNLESKVDAHRKIKDLESRRKKLRARLFDAQDEVDERKEAVIGEIEQRLKQKLKETPLFIIQWRVI
ncbi:DEAD/DEAH box helicase family protein [bacterium]|nr:DEAD/DEAH box helicase family protein [bacterium]